MLSSFHPMVLLAERYLSDPVISPNGDPLPLVSGSIPHLNPPICQSGTTSTCCAGMTVCSTGTVLTIFLCSTVSQMFSLGLWCSHWELTSQCHHECNYLIGLGLCRCWKGVAPCIWWKAICGDGRSEGWIFLFHSSLHYKEWTGKTKIIVLSQGLGIHNLSQWENTKFAIAIKKKRKKKKKKTHDSFWSLKYMKNYRWIW